MMPRGEVTLIFASLGGTLLVNGAPVIDTQLHSVLVAVVILTTLLTPLALKRSWLRGHRETSESSVDSEGSQRRA